MSIIINGIRTITGRKSSSQRMVLQRYVSNLLNQNIDDIVELTKNASKKQLSLLGVLAENFNRFNFYRKPAERDNSKIINEIFNKIKKPNEKHRYLCANFSDSLNDLNSIITISCYDEIHDIYISYPAIINRSGVREILKMELTNDEKDKLNNSIHAIQSRL